jgi:hypothetical protein
MEAINLYLEALGKTGDIVAVEAPTYHGILQDAIGRHLESGQYLIFLTTTSGSTIAPFGVPK